MEGIYIGGRSIRTFGAKLRTDYTISGPSPSRTLRREPRTGSFSLLDTGWGLLTLKLPMDFYGGSRGEIAWNMAGLRGLLQKETEIDLGDGFLYRCVLTAAGSESWTGEVLCSQKLTLQGIRHGQGRTVTGKSPLKLYNPGTYPRTDCTISIPGFRPKGTSPAVIALSAGGKTILRWEIAPDAALTGKTLLLDGVEKRSRYGAGALPGGAMTWREYPYLPPGECSVAVTGAEMGEISVSYEPVYI